MRATHTTPAQPYPYHPGARPAGCSLPLRTLTQTKKYFFFFSLLFPFYERQDSRTASLSYRGSALLARASFSAPASAQRLETSTSVPPHPSPKDITKYAEFTQSKRGPTAHTAQRLLNCHSIASRKAKPFRLAPQPKHTHALPTPTP